MPQKQLHPDLEIGDEIPALVKIPTLKTAVKWACAAGDYHETHFDPDYARSMGLPGVIVHGGVIFSYLSQMITDWIGEWGTVRKLDCSYRGMFFPGEAVVCRGRVTGKYSESGGQRLECEIWAENPDGEKLAAGTAVIAFTEA